MQYKNGTILLSQNEDIVTGFLTRFTTYVKPGDRLFIRNESVSYVVSGVLTDTTLKLTAPYARSTKNTAYSIVVDYSQHFGLMMTYQNDHNALDIIRLNTAKIDALLNVGVNKEPDTIAITSVSAVKVDTTSYRLTFYVSSTASNIEYKVTDNNSNIKDWLPCQTGFAYNQVTTTTPTNHAIVIQARADNLSAIQKTTSIDLTDTGGGGGGGTGNFTVLAQPLSTEGTYGKNAGVSVSSDETNVDVEIKFFLNGTESSWHTDQNPHRLPKNNWGISSFEANFPIRVEVSNSSKTESWQWDDYFSAPRQLGTTGGGGGGTIGDFTVVMDAIAAGTNNPADFKTGINVTSATSGVTVTIELFQWNTWQSSWFIHQDVSLPFDYHNHEQSGGSFPIKYKVTSGSTVETWTYETSSSTATKESSTSVGGASDILFSLIATQVNQQHDITIVATANAYSPQNPAFLDLFINNDLKESKTFSGSLTSTLTFDVNIDEIIDPNVEVRVAARGPIGNENSLTQNLVMSYPSAKIASTISNYTVTSGEKTLTVTADIADSNTPTEQTSYKIFFGTIEKHTELNADHAAISHTFNNLTPGVFDVKLKVLNTAGLVVEEMSTVTVADITNTSATIANLAHTITFIPPPSGGTTSVFDKNVNVTADIDVPAGNGGIHYRFVRYRPGETPALTGWEWVQDQTTAQQVSRTFQHDSADFVYRLDAKVQNETPFTTSTITVAGEPIAANTATITSVIQSSTATDYTIGATVSNSNNESMEYQIEQDGTVVKAWTGISSGASFSEIQTVAASTYSVVIKTRSLTAVEVSHTESIIVQAAAGGSLVNAGDTRTVGDLTVEIVSLDWNGNIVIRGTNNNGSNTNLIMKSTMNPWETVFGTAYELTSGYTFTIGVGGAGSGSRYKVKVQLGSDIIETDDLVKP